MIYVSNNHIKFLTDLPKPDYGQVDRLIIIMIYICKFLCKVHIKFLTDLPKSDYGLVGRFVAVVHDDLLELAEVHVGRSTHENLNLELQFYGLNVNMYVILKVNV